MKRSKGKLQLDKYVSYSIKPLTSAELEKICASMQVSSFQFSMLLAPSDYQLQIVESPSIPAEELKAAIRWQVKDSLSYPVENAMIDVLPVPANQNALDRPKSLFVVSASNDVLKKYISLFDDAKLNINVIDIPEMAQRNIAALFEDEGRGLAVLAFDENGGLLTVSSGGELYMSRRIDISLGQLLDADEMQRQQYFDRLEVEIQRSLDYFDRNFNYVTVNRMLISAPSQSGLLEKLKGNLSVPVESLDLSQVMDLTMVSALADRDAQVDAFYVLGAALRQEG